MTNTKNIFEETVKTLTSDAQSLQTKFSELQKKNDFRGAIDCMRLLKDTLSLIKEYDWQQMYSEYESDGNKQVSVWEQNHCGEIRNHKVWTVGKTINRNIDENRWYKMFDDAIFAGKSLIADNGSFHRYTGKSYALAKLCKEYDGIVSSKISASTRGIENCEFDNIIVDYKSAITLRQYRNKIVFIDEGNGFSDDDIQNLQKNHIVIGFK